MKFIYSVLVLMCFGLKSLAQAIDQKNQKSAADTSVQSGKVKSKLKAYQDIVNQKTASQFGAIIVHKNDDKYYFEIADSVLNRDFMVVLRAAKLPGGAQLYGGEIISQQTVYFERATDDKVFLRLNLLISAADSSNAIFQAVNNSYYDPILVAFPIQGRGTHSSVLDVTDFLKSDNPLVSLPQSGRSISKQVFRASALLNDMSYLMSLKSFARNTEIRTVKTFATAALLGTVSFELNTSILLLPAKPMTKRVYDKRVGYFADQYDVYSDDQQRLSPSTFIVRWKLVPKQNEMDQYFKGILVEPETPIVYYIDPATPEKWRPYLKQGIEDWQKAFEKAGFKKAIIAKDWPVNDSAMSLEDARYSVLRYFASNAQNAYGPNVHDPRSGEILESHIGWYHNVMKLLHDWYMIQCGPLDTGAQKMNFDDALMGQLIRFVSSHEVGHTLGLRHNMGASFATPVDSLRKNTFLRKYGHTASIMDYARFNYVAQPEDSIDRANLFPRINDYDEWAIEWGYRYLGIDDVEEDQKLTGKWITDRVTNNQRLWFGGEGQNGDPRSQSEDLGNNAVEAGKYGILNLKRVMNNLLKWTNTNRNSYDQTFEMYFQVCNQFSRYMMHAIASIGGVFETQKGQMQPGPVYSQVPFNTQKEALRFIGRELFQTPKWLLDTTILNRVQSPTDNSANTYVTMIQSRVLSSLLSSNGTLKNLRGTSARFGIERSYSIQNLFDDLTDLIFEEVKTGVVKDAQRRALQNTYILELSTLINPVWSPSQDQPGTIMLDQSSKLTDLGALVIAQLNRIDMLIREQQSVTKDSVTQKHFKAIRIRIKAALDGKKFP